MNDLENERFNPVLYQDKAELDNLIKLKHRLKELIRSESIIEAIIKHFQPDEIFVINKYFEVIKKEF